MIGLIQTLWNKTLRLHWGLLFFVTALCCFGFLLMYAAAGGSMDPYASRQMVRFAIGLGIMWLIAMTDPKLLYRSMPYLIYGLALILLIYAAVRGHTGMGATRWVNLGFFLLQPSELMKVGVVLMLARFYHTRPAASINTPGNLIIPALIMLMPAALVFDQPDLGTAIIIVALGVCVMFAAGVSLKLFTFLGVAGAAMLPIAWSFLHDYQKNRVLTFLDPERDPLGAGYHIIQSKIAIGSAGLWGKGFLQGTQSQLAFLPEKHTDFIFTLLTEEMGFVGAFVLMLCFAFVLLFCATTAVRSQNTFNTILCTGIMLMIFFHAFINMAMVMGLLPVVGVPLPFVSYGGSSLLTMMIAIGLVMNSYVHKEVVIPGAVGLSAERVFHKW